MGRISYVVNRNGEIVPFRRNRIVRAILASVRAAGSKDEWVADKLADMVVYFLDAQHGASKSPPGADDVDDMIEKALLSSPDLHDVARAFIEGRRQRREIREIEEVAPQPGPRVATPEAGVDGWNRAYITAALMREHKLDAGKAAEIAAIVEQRVLELKLPSVSTSLIRELVDVELLARGLSSEPGSVSVPRFDIEQWVFPGDETEQPPVADQAELAGRASRRLMTQYGLSILPVQSRQAHLDARVHFAALHAPAAVADLRLDVNALLGPGAGFGLQRMYAQSTSGVAAAFARLAGIVAAASSFCAGPVTLAGLDSALGRDEPEQVDRAQVQDGLRLIAALAPAGLVLEVGPPGSSARDLVTRTMIDALASADGALRAQVRLELAVTPGAFADPARKALLERAASAAGYCGAPAFRLHEPQASRAAGLFGEAATVTPHSVVLSRAAINLVRPAIGVDEVNAYLAALEPAIELAVSGLSAHARYLERVALRDMPEPVAPSTRMLRVLAAGSRAVQLSPLGLGLAASLLSGAPEADPASVRVAQQVLSWLDFRFRERSSRAGLQGSLGWRVEPHVSASFARESVALATRGDPDSPLRLRLSAEEALRPGAMLDTSVALPLRLEAEAGMHGLLGRDATIKAEGMTQAEVLEALRACVSEHGPRPCKLEVTVTSRTCRDCGARYPAQRESCPVCGSTAWAVPPGQKSLFG